MQCRGPKAADGFCTECDPDLPEACTKCLVGAGLPQDAPAPTTGSAAQGLAHGPLKPHVSASVPC